MANGHERTRRQQTSLHGLQSKCHFITCMYVHTINITKTQNDQPKYSRVALVAAHSAVHGKNQRVKI